MLQIEKYRAFLFDMDGTLMYSEPAHIRAMSQALLELLDYRMTWEDGNEYIGITAQETGRRILQRLGYVGEVTPERLGQRKQEILLGGKLEIPAYPGACEFVQEACQAGITQVLASNSLPEFINYCLESHGIAGCFQQVLSIASAARPKPAPDIFLEAARAAGVPPAECLVFEDSSAGVASGLAAGCEVVLVLNPANYLPREIPEGIAKLTWQELRQLLRQSRA